jgi:hypothetical protein
MSTNCRDTLRAIGAGDIAAAPALPAGCTVEQAVAALPGLGSADDNPGSLGAGTSVRWRALRSGVAGELLRVWHDQSGIVAVELGRPQPRGGLPALKAALGPPPARLDHFSDVVANQGGLWVYPARGLALYLSLAETRLDRAVVFPPTTAEDYATRLAMGQQPPREFPGD